MVTGSFTIEGDVNVEVVVTQNADGTLTFDLTVLDDTGTIGDLNAFYFDLADDSLTDSLSVSDVSYTNRDGTTGSDYDTAFKVDGVTKVDDSYTSMNGEVVKDLGKFDGGISFGTSGMAQDDVASASFTLSSSTQPLILSDFNFLDFGIRLTSVGTLDGAREESLKLGIDDAEMTVDGGGGGDTGTGGGGGGTTTGAGETIFSDTDDSFPPSEFGDFWEDLNTDFHITGEDTLIFNDPGATGISSVNGVEIAQGATIIVEGTNGGYLKINSDGYVDFSASDEFGTLSGSFAGTPEGTVTETAFNYVTDNGLEATLLVSVTTAGSGGGEPPVGVA